MRPCDRQCAVHVLYEDFWWLVNNIGWFFN